MPDKPSHIVYIALGSNIEPEKNVELAIDEMKKSVKIVDMSYFYETQAISSEHQPPFLNGVVKCETPLEARALKFDVLRIIEDKAGRNRTADKYAPRTLDLDLLLYDDRVIAEPDLRIPDPEIRERIFLAKTLLELAPGLKLPGDGNSLEDYFTPDEFAALRPQEVFTSKLKERIRK